MNQAISISVVILATSFVGSVLSKLSRPVCLTGTFHKQQPSQETVEYKACYAYKDNTCCTADFTRQIDVSPIRKIGNFSWVSCTKKGFSKKCENFMKEVECFYQCSPNVGYWKGQFRGSFVGVPVCSTFCDAWFDACQDDQTCAKNWITGFDYDKSGNNKCKTTGKCRTFSDVYGNGTSLCNSMWGTSFKYTVSQKANDCMHLTGVNNGSNPNVLRKNTMVAETYFSIGSGSLALEASKSFAVVSIMIATYLTMGYE